MRTLNWILTNSIFAALTIAWLVYGNDNAGNLSVFWIYFLAITATFAAGNKDIVEQAAAKWRKEGLPVPNWLDWTFDIAITALLLWTGHFWYASLYLWHGFAIASIKQKAKTNP